jgi:hypothetical protein
LFILFLKDNFPKNLHICISCRELRIVTADRIENYRLNYCFGTFELRVVKVSTLPVSACRCVLLAGLDGYQQATKALVQKAGFQIEKNLSFVPSLELFNSITILLAITCRRSTDELNVG